LYSKAKQTACLFTDTEVNMGPIAAVIGAVATVGGTVLSYSAQQKAASAQKKQQNLETRRSQRQAIREAQIKRAQALASGANMGALGGSALAGGTGALGSQLGSGLGFSTQMSGLSNVISSQTNRANMFSSLASIGSAVYQNSGGFQRSDTANKAPTAAPSNPAYRPAFSRAI